MKYLLTFFAEILNLKIPFVFEIRITFKNTTVLNTLCVHKITQ